jgi:hypothetical protein
MKPDLNPEHLLRATDDFAGRLAKLLADLVLPDDVTATVDIDPVSLS